MEPVVVFASIERLYYPFHLTGHFFAVVGEEEQHVHR
jgi:FtsP/CotA-like multicopper oxidase with cupredoxin domain